jgi:hypothetical protein
VNAEHSHQLFGGEISDYLKMQDKVAPEFNESFVNNDQHLSDVYNTHVKPVGQVAVTNSPTNMSVDSFIEHQPDPLVIQLQNTLSKVAQEYGLTSSDNSTNINFEPILKDQSAADIQQSNDAVMKALEELKALSEI